MPARIVVAFFTGGDVASDCDAGSPDSGGASPDRRQPALILAPKGRTVGPVMVALRVPGFHSKCCRSEGALEKGGIPVAALSHG
jgi:hypothetical protein